ncbi:MAG: diguanylate cyclase [Planctomycetes bacterium]|nr:diguanylate cyclase [Planctomycetota bacterium]
MLEDSKGNYWFGSWSEGVCRFDGEHLTYFTVADGLSDNQIRSIHEDANGVVWFEGGFGVSGFDGAKIVTPTTKDYSARNEWQLRPNALWFKGDGAVGPTEREAQPGVYRFDGTTFTFQAFPVVVAPSAMGAYATTGIAKGQNGRIWFATYAAVFGFDGASFTILDDASLGLDSTTGQLHVRSVYEDQKGRLWIGNNGIGVLLREGTAVRQFTQEQGLGKMGSHGGRTVPLPGDVAAGSPSMHRVFSIGEDATGNLWFGTVESGAWRYDGTSVQHFGAAAGLTTPDVMGIYRDRSGTLWLAGKGVFRWNGASFDRVF